MIQLSKETVLNTLNILGDKFKIGKKLHYLVVVGDGKSYDHLIKLKNEYGNSLNWVLPYPGDWHILKNILPIFVKIYFDAGLKELALKFHRGATVKVLTDCTKFQITNRFFIHVWEALFRYQIQTRGGFGIRGGVRRRGIWGPLKVPSGSRRTNPTPTPVSSGGLRNYRHLFEQF
jgi:hypothetical protein